MDCELCGSGIRGEPQSVNIDGGIFRVCDSCSRLGTPARVPSRPSLEKKPARLDSQPPRSQARSVRRFDASEFEDQEVELDRDYPKLIKKGREQMGLSQEEVGMKINEKPSVISHLENGSMKPSDPLARKLEHFLRIKLFVPVEELDESSA
ncbi:MAG: multiprotein bridging factor aMBF1 [Nitrososphaerales archaeon]